MVILNKIYTRTGDEGLTALGTGERLKKHHLRISAYGTIDETNACIGLVRLQTQGDTAKNIDTMLARIQNDLFDLGADLCAPDNGEKPDYTPLRITQAQVDRLESEIDLLTLNFLRYVPLSCPVAVLRQLLFILPARFRDGPRD